jgi:hypothetical protein
MTPTTDKTQKIKEAAGMLELYKSELNKIGLDKHIGVMSCMELYSPEGIEQALYALSCLETEGPLEALRQTALEALRRAQCADVPQLMAG